MEESPFAVTGVAVAERSAFVEPRAAPTIVVLSSPKQVNLAVYRGDTGQFRITVTDSVGAPINISGYSWDGDIRAKATDPTVITNFVIVPVVGDTSSIDVKLSAAASALLVGTMVYDIEMRTGVAPNEVVQTLIYGNIIATQDVSRPT